MVEGPALTRSTMVKLRTQGKIQTGFEEEKIGPEQTSESQGSILLPRNTDSQKAMEKLEGQRGPSSHSHLEFTFRRPNEMVGRTDVRLQEPQVSDILLPTHTFSEATGRYLLPHKEEQKGDVGARAMGV